MNKKFSRRDFLKTTGIASGGLVLAVYLEENAQRQYMAMQIGKPYVFDAAEQKAAIEKLWTASLFQRTWDHYRSKLD